MHDMNILFIHGFGGTQLEHQKIRRNLAEHTHFIFNYTKKWGTISLHMLAKNVSKKYTDIDVIIGMSQGGIIATLAHEVYGLSVKKIITICTPFKGSLLSYMIYFVGVKELRPKSKLLQLLNEKLSKSQTKYYAIYNPLDLMVFPGTSAKNPYAIKTESVFALSHLSTFSSTKTIKFILESIK